MRHSTVQLERYRHNPDSDGMHEIDASNTVAYLHDTGHLPHNVGARVEPLAWGVSNFVLRVTPETGAAFVIKQSRGQLRTNDPWFSRLDRIWREVGIMRLIEPMLPCSVVPKVLFDDRPNYLFAMEAAPADHVVWKQSLLAGDVNAEIAKTLGAYLAAIHRQTAFRSDVERDWGDTEVFVQLRVDPFYRKVAAKHPDIAPQINAMIDEMFATPICLVHADFSPKNVLVHEHGLTLVDFETGHYGDAAFDHGFFLSHLLLKAILHAARFDEYAALTTNFWSSYLAGLGELTRNGPFATTELTRRSIAHLAGCMLARVDGTSKVDYLNTIAQQQVRDYCRTLFESPPADWGELIERLRRNLH